MAHEKLSQQNVWFISRRENKSELLSIFWNRRKMNLEGALSPGANAYLDVLLSRDPIITSFDIDPVPMMRFPDIIDADFVRFAKWTGADHLFSELMAVFYHSRERFENEASVLMLDFIRKGASYTFRFGAIRRPEKVDAEYIDLIVREDMKQEILDLFWDRRELIESGVITRTADEAMIEIIKQPTANPVISSVDMEGLEIMAWPNVIDDRLVRFIIYTGATDLIQSIIEISEQTGEARTASVTSLALMSCREWLFRNASPEPAIEEAPAPDGELVAGFEPERADDIELEPAIGFEEADGISRKIDIDSAADDEISRLAEVMADNVMKAHIKSNLAEIIREHQKKQLSEIWPDAIVMRDEVRNPRLYVELGVLAGEFFSMMDQSGISEDGALSKIIDRVIDKIAGDVTVGYAPKVVAVHPIAVHPIAVTLSRALLR